MDDLLWIVIVAFVISFILAFGIGANDVANSFATTIGAGVLTLRQACILASIFEIAGAILIGYKVSDTIRKGILDITLYEGCEKELMLGMLAALTSCAIWLLVATFLKFPVSATHSIVGATVGFGLVAKGSQGIQWNTIIGIALSWVISPILAGVISVGIYLIIYRFILRAKEPFKAGLAALPIIWGLVIFINVLGISLDGSQCKLKIKISKKLF
jgi:solute carrier family 20 (sodium-dependent phosphate transporter)